VTGALVSGQDGVAVFQDGSRLWCVRPQSPAPEPISHGLLPYLFVNIADASYHPEATLESTGRVLEKAWREERALHLALISMDPASSEPTRELAEEALEEFLEDDQISEFIENRLFSDRLPESALWSSNVASAYPRVTLLKRSVLDAQDSIGRVRAAWDALPEELFAEPDDRARFELLLVETGAFRILANAATDKADRYSKGEAQLRLLSDLRHQTFTNYRNILLQWTKTIPSPSQGIALLIREERDDEKPESRREKLPKAPTYEAFQNVVVQKEAILEQLRRRNPQQVERFVDDLVRLQLSSNKPDLAAKSLCDLARGAKEFGFLAYQLAWCRRAKEICPEDPWVHTQFADALLGQGDLSEALEAYETTVADFPQNAVARNGKAELLKALGRLPEALEVYKGTVTDFPQNVVTRSGKAEVLKALGRLPEALVAYESTVADFPQDVVARSGKAEVLKALGRLPEALEAYENTVTDFPQDAVARSGKAEVLKALGRLPEALVAYESTVADFPQNVVARTGKAEALKALGRLPEALEAYESTVADFPQDVFARTGKAEVLKALGRLPGALEAYESTVADFPQDVFARTGMATLLVLLGRYEEAAALVGTDRTQTREEWIGLHIRASIKLKQGHFDEADKLFSAGQRCPWADVRSRFTGARAVLRIRKSRLKEAAEMIRSEQSELSKVIQIDVYRRMKRIGEARSVLRELRDCHVAEIVKITQDLEQNMKPGKRTVSDDEFLDREFALLMAA
jgi:tetratricopeptide (TPR) repeat protein